MIENAGTEYTSSSLTSITHATDVERPSLMIMVLIMVVT